MILPSNVPPPLTPGGIVRGDVYAGAEFSSCGRYRYRLWRRPRPVDPYIALILCNPSKAGGDDAGQDGLDPTARKVNRFVRRWARTMPAGSGGWVMVNVLAWIATDPWELHAVPDPVGPYNEDAIFTTVRSAALVVAAWGVHKTLRTHAPVLTRKLQDAGVALHCIRQTTTGAPEHPLYLPSALVPVPWPQLLNS